ncbi:unnamed protein product [Didymodactylos carnosus]|uniref:EGF-like domain-containing protein n=1 Tax=Didymodactylos carnosus TaxID=1234261 RepID=A0A814J8E3_9BILA|nr:unnamed protein product [Didymodactylos carnosus]CAF3804736.1 unnamed protein product [Didymodactylos carnosus]
MNLWQWYAILNTDIEADVEVLVDQHDKLVKLSTSPTKQLLDENLCQCHNNGICWNNEINKGWRREDRLESTLGGCICLPGYTGLFCEIIQRQPQPQTAKARNSLSPFPQNQHRVEVDVFYNSPDSSNLTPTTNRNYPSSTHFYEQVI